MKKLVLFGNTNFTKLIKYFLEVDANRKIEFVTVDREYITEETFDGVPVVAFDEFLNFYDKDKYEVLVSIGYSKMNILRQQVFEKLKKHDFCIASYIHSSALIASNAIIGVGNIILENVVIQPFCRIGNANLIWHSANIAHNCDIGSYNTIASNSSLNGFVKMTNNSFIGSNAVIRDHTNISDFTLIGAGTFLSKDTSNYEVYVPEKAIKLQHKSTDIRL